MYTGTLRDLHEFDTIFIGIHSVLRAARASGEGAIWATCLVYERYSRAFQSLAAKRGRHRSNHLHSALPSSNLARTLTSI